MNPYPDLVPGLPDDERPEQPDLDGALHQRPQHARLLQGHDAGVYAGRSVNGGVLVGVLGIFIEKEKLSLLPTKKAIFLF